MQSLWAQLQQCVTLPKRGTSLRSTQKDPLQADLRASRHLLRKCLRPVAYGLRRMKSTKMMLPKLNDRLEDRREDVLKLKVHLKKARSLA